MLLTLPMVSQLCPYPGRGLPLKIGLGTGVPSSRVHMPIDQKASQIERQTFASPNREEEVETGRGTLDQILRVCHPLSQFLLLTPSEGLIYGTQSFLEKSLIQ